MIGNHTTLKHFLAVASSRKLLLIATLLCSSFIALGPDANDVDPTSTNGDNYWGYSTLNYFAPDRRYSSAKSPGGPSTEFRKMVKTCHDYGIKVLIDVVYNHTGEGYAWNAADKNTYNIISWRGLDNPTYYSLTSDLQGSWDNTGVGGNYNTHNTVAQDMIVCTTGDES